MADTEITIRFDDNEFDIDDLINHHIHSIKWFNEHPMRDVKSETIKRHAANIKYLQELKELKQAKED